MEVKQNVSSFETAEHLLYDGYDSLKSPMTYTVEEAEKFLFLDFKNKMHSYPYYKKAFEEKITAGMFIITNIHPNSFLEKIKQADELYIMLRTFDDSKLLLYHQEHIGGTAISEASSILRWHILACRHIEQGFAL